MGISSTKSCCSKTVEVDDGWKFFYSGIEPARFAQAGVGIRASPQLPTCVDELIPLGERVCIFRFKLLEGSLI